MPDPNDPRAQEPTWQRLWKMLMGRQALQQAAGTQAPPPMPQQQDTSMVQRAAEEAGRRNEEEQARLAAQKVKPYAEGGVIRPPISSNNDRLRRANSEMVENSRLAQQGIGEAWNTDTLADYLSADPAERNSRLQESAMRSMREQRLKTLMEKMIEAGNTKQVKPYCGGGIVRPGR